MEYSYISRRKLKFPTILSQLSSDEVCLCLCRLLVSNLMGPCITSLPFCFPVFAFVVNCSVLASGSFAFSSAATNKISG